MAERGVWGNGDTHGNTPAVLSSLIALIKGWRLRPNSPLSHLYDNGVLTLEGEKVRAKVLHLLPMITKDKYDTNSRRIQADSL